MDSNEQLKLKKYLKFSLGLHGGLLLLMVASEFISPSTSEIFQPSVQIDMVALPDLVKAQNAPVVDTTLPVKDAPPPPPPPPPPEEKAPVAKAEEKPEPAVADEMALKKEKAAESEAKKAMERLKAQMRKQQREEERLREAEINKRQEGLKRFEETYRAALRGNQTNQGTSASGAIAEARNAYFGHMTERLRSNWALPAWLQGKGLRAVVRMYVDNRGHAIRYNFVQSSGNDVFDEYVKRAIKDSSPFAPPPEEMAKGLRNNGLELEFPL